jgi:hypothetical protein
MREMALMREAHVQRDFRNRMLQIGEEPLRRFDSALNDKAVHRNTHGLAKRSLAMADTQTACRSDLL